VNLRFPGQYYDQETQTHDNFHRDYRPNAGRYLQEDPIGLEGGVNVYGYVNLHPLNNVDFLDFMEVQIFSALIFITVVVVVNHGM
jgi:rhs family protein